ncbi:hypothetical protein ACTWQF_34010 [Streptomyces sp. 8N114]|uniref:hypothetical protein n=1 Tax=Streptomyces sp. 8N114 TaxID=3457419 RepID=UPI003FD0BE53
MQMKTAARKRTTATLIRNRASAAAHLLQRAEQWDSMGEHALPHGIEVLNRLRSALDEVKALDAVLRQRFEAGAAASRDKHPAEEAADFRRRLFAALRKGRLALEEIATGEAGSITPEQLPLVDNTHAFALVRAQAGHHRAIEAFEAQRLPVGVDWKQAAPHIPALCSFLSQQRRSEPEDVLQEKATAIDVAMTRQAADQAALRGRMMDPAPPGQ